MKHPIILTDADNTLWDTNSVFANAQTGLLSVVEKMIVIDCPRPDRLAFVRSYDQALAAVHHAILKYPPMMLVQSLVLGLRGMDPIKAADVVVRGNFFDSILSKELVSSAFEDYKILLAQMPELLPTVKNGLETLRNNGIGIYIITEGILDIQKKILEHHALDGLIQGMFELRKDLEQFQRLRQRFLINDVVVIGDQPDRDIIPAKKAGCVTILVPSRFRPQWLKEDQDAEAHFVAATFNSAAEWVLNR